MSEPTTLTAALAAVEAAWDKPMVGDDEWEDEVFNALDDLLAALRAVRSSGGRTIVLRRETVEALTRAFAVPVYDDMTGRWVEAARELWLDFMPLLKETT